MKGFKVFFLFTVVCLLFTGITPSFAQVQDTIINSTDPVLMMRDSIPRIKNVEDTIPQKPVVDSPVVVKELPAPSYGPYTVTGIVKDKNTGEGVPFATVFFPNSPLGVSADLDGRFVLKFNSPPGDSIMARAVGYERSGRYLDRNKKTVEYIIELERDEKMLEEAVVHGGEDPALVLLKKIIRQKPENNPDKLENYRYEVYNKLEVDMERLSKKQFERLPIPMTKKFSFIYDNLDTITEGKPFLPFYLTETLSDYYFQLNPKKTKEFIKASQVKGVKNESVTQFLGSMYQNLNAYANFIPVFDKQFISPISNSGAFYYKYKIKDTQEAYGHKIILVQFEPKREGENCFFGDFWVADSVFALQRISMEVPSTANINWVSDVSVYQEYAPVGDTLWFCVKDKFIAHFVAPYNAKLPGFIGRKTTSYKKIITNDPVISAVVNDPQLKLDVYVADTARNVGDEFWSTARHDTLTANEKKIYAMVDTLNKMPVFTTYKNLIKFFASGVKEVGPIEIGPYWNVYSSNPIEGSRFRLSLGTTPKFSKDIYVNGYLAYGALDQAFKYKLAALWLFKHEFPRSYVYASYTRDIDRSTSYYDQVSNDNIFALAFRKKNIPWKLAMVDESRFEFYKEYYNGFSHQLVLLRKAFNPYAPLPSVGIFKDDEGRELEEVVSSEVGLKLRYAYKEKFLEGNYYRVSLGSKYPVVEARLGLGLKNVLKSNYSYQRVSLSVSDYIKIAPLGTLYVNLFAGKYFGTLPYNLLEAHPGNEFLFYNKYAFNMMNRFEFLSDQYAGVNLEHSIGGGIFNYIPYVKKLKFRQFWTAKGVVGSLSDENRALNFDKGYAFRTLEGSPYVEVGTGVENIFQFFRIDFVWRVTPRAQPGEPQEKYFGIFGSVKFNF